MKVIGKEIYNWSFLPSHGDYRSLMEAKKLRLCGDNGNSFGNLGFIANLFEEQGQLIARMYSGETYILSKKKILKSWCCSYNMVIKRLEINCAD